MRKYRLVEFIFNLMNRRIFTHITVICKRRIRIRHLLQRHFRRANCQRQPVVTRLLIERCDAELFSSGDGFLDAILLHDFNRRNIERTRQRLSNRHITIVTPSSVLWLIAIDIDRLILDNRRRRDHALRQRRRVVNRLERTARLTLGRRHIYLAPLFVIVINTANQRANLTSFWINRDQPRVRSTHLLDIANLPLHVRHRLAL